MDQVAAGDWKVRLRRNPFGSQMGEAVRDGAQHRGAKRRKVTRSLKSRKIPHDKGKKGCQESQNSKPTPPGIEKVHF